METVRCHSFDTSQCPAPSSPVEPCFYHRVLTEEPFPQGGQVETIASVCAVCEGCSSLIDSSPSVETPLPSSPISWVWAFIELVR